jgi:hypothetical protein
MSGLLLAKHREENTLVERALHMRRLKHEDQPRRRSERTRKENWAQFELGDPETEAAELSDLEASLPLNRRWNVDGAANVYFRGKGTLWVVGQDVVSCHRFRHRRWAPEECGKICVARDLYAYCLLCLPTDLHPRVMPIWRILGRLVAQAVDYAFAESASFHREVTRDLSRLRTVLNKPPARGRLRPDKALLSRYAGTAAVLRANQKTGEPRAYHRTIRALRGSLKHLGAQGFGVPKEYLTSARIYSQQPRGQILHSVIPLKELENNVQL